MGNVKLIMDSEPINLGVNVVKFWPRQCPSDCIALEEVA